MTASANACGWLERQKQLPTVQRAIAYASEALQWLQDDGLATAVDVLGFAPCSGWLVLMVEVASMAATGATA